MEEASAGRSGQLRRRSSAALAMAFGDKRAAAARLDASEPDHEMALDAETGTALENHRNSSRSRGFVDALKRRSKGKSLKGFASGLANLKAAAAASGSSQDPRARRRHLSVRFEDDMGGGPSDDNNNVNQLEMENRRSTGIPVTTLLMGSPGREVERVSGRRSRDDSDEDGNGLTSGNLQGHIGIDDDEDEFSNILNRQKDATQSEVDDYLREMFSNDGSSSLSSAEEAEAAFLLEPSEDPEILIEQFRVASSHSDAYFLDKILNYEAQMARKLGLTTAQPIIPNEDKAKALALAMLSGKLAVYRVLVQCSSIPDADIWLDHTHPHTRCKCESHRGSLLVRLVRSGHHTMCRAALKSGLNPDSQICDGNTRRLTWYDPAPRNYMREPTKLEAVFEKSTPLTSAAALNDVRMLDLLLDFGADPSLNNYAAFGTAARFGHISFLERMLNIYSSRIVENSDANFTALQKASTVALKEASAAGQEATLDWILQRLQQTFDWENNGPSKSSKLKSDRRGTFGAIRLRRATAPAAQQPSVRKSSLKILRRPRRSESMSNQATIESQRLPPSAQQVAQVLDKALDQLIEEGIEPGANLRFSIAQGIALITKLQKSRFAEFAPKQLLRFYMLGTSDPEMLASDESIVALLLDCGLGQYLLGKETLVRSTDSGRWSTTSKEGTSSPSDSDSDVKSGKKKRHSRRRASRLQSSFDEPDEENIPENEDRMQYVDKMLSSRGSQDDTQKSRGGVSASSAETSSSEDRMVKHPSSAQTQNSASGELISRLHLPVRVVAAVTVRLFSGMVGSSTKDPNSGDSSPDATLTRSSSLLGPVRTVPPGYQETHAVASEKERHSAVFTAVQRGHRAVLQLLLDLCSDHIVELLLTESARYDQAEMARILLQEIQKRTALAEAEAKLKQKQQTEEPRRSSRRKSKSRKSRTKNGIPNAVLRSAWRAALCVGHTGIADLLNEYGVSPKRSDVIDVLTVVCQSTDRAEHQAVPYLLENRQISELVCPQDLGTIFYEAINEDSPNFMPLRDMCLFSHISFCEVRHLRRLMHRSCGLSTNDAWRVLTDLCVKNIQLSPEGAEELRKSIPKLITEAESLPDVHVGVLTFLMHVSDVSPDAEDEESNRWL